MVRVSFPFSISFPKWAIFTFYFFTSLHGLQDVENHCDHLPDIELKTGRKFHISAFAIYYSRSNWIGEHGITKLKKMFASNPEKRTQKQAQKDINEMEWHKMDFLIFSAMRLRKRRLFCTSSHHNTTSAQQGVWALKWVSLLERVRNW